MATEFLYGTEDLPEIAAVVLTAGGAGGVYTLEGELGAGKTTLVAEVCRRLGVEEPTSSPTFSIVNEYRGAGGRVYHLDCYRLRDVQEALDAGLEELFDGSAPVFVEWPAVIQPLLPEGVISLRLSHTDREDRRKLTIQRQTHE